ncbi:hypothetical protein HRG_013008 [Hirsutella rhossiliensis]
MPSSTHAIDDDQDALPEHSTPSRPASDAKTPRDDDSSHAPTTPTSKNQRAAPKSAPAAAGSRARSNSRKPEPTLLTDFLKGRPSPARLAAERRRRLSVEAIKAELRYEMRQSAVRKIQAPGGVRDRVQTWQKSNASAMAQGDPDDAATEPPDVAFRDDDLDSVTEEDRIRIKMRQNKRRPSNSNPFLHTAPAAKASERDKSPDTARPNSPPKKRVVSDDNWRKPKARKNSPKVRKSPTLKPSPIPPDFVLRSAPNPSVPKKIKAWAAKVDAADNPPPPRYRPNQAQSSSSRSEGVSDGGYTSSHTTKHAPSSTPRAGNGICVTPLGDKADRGGIRINTSRRSSGRGADGSLRLKSKDAARPRVKTDTSPASRPGGRATPGSERDVSFSDHIEVMTDPSEHSSTVRSHYDDGSDRIQVIEEPDSVLDTPTRGSGSKRRFRRCKPRVIHPAPSSILSQGPSGPGDEASYLGTALNEPSELSSSLANKSMADIPGDIPFGHSAFSELDLPFNQSKPKRAKVDRNSSLKTMPNVFKKVMEEGKKMIHDINEPPKQPAINSPPSIEKWLNSTVDPFVENSAKPSATTVEEQTLHDSHSSQHRTKSRRRSSHETRPSRQSTPRSDDAESREGKAPRTDSTGTATETEVGKEPTSPTASALQRRRALKGPSSPRRSPGRRPFLGVLKEAFQGESTGHGPRPMSYQGHEERLFNSHDPAASSYHSSDYTSTSVSRDTPRAAESDRDEQVTPRAAPRPRPPTSGKQELSTILSEDDSSALSSDLASDLSISTMTQSTTVTRDSEPGRSHGHAPGLKRRLTRHSDLVSVLSLPDDSSIPSGIRDKRSRPSLRKARGTVDVTADELLREFVDDENLYLRQLKTMVDGVVPVLLSHVVYGTSATELFGSSPSKPGSYSLSKSVVSMGVALEKLNNAHKKASTSDIRKLSHWAHGIVPIYSSYLSAWRLGFEDVVVNLAPAEGSSGDDDSLLNALPRNESGDIVNAEGERVAVAYLLKRPLIRVKQLARFFQCVDAIQGSSDTHDLVRDFEVLQEKARRRHKEETARMTDEDAVDTDTARTRDLRTLESAKSPVKIDPSRQVNAKDLFSLSLAHSNGQRLECQVELVHRDKQSHPGDEGDLLIRETGDLLRSYLLFAPISMSVVSARASMAALEMVVMVHGTYNGRAWHELLTLGADSEDQIQDWLDIFPRTPVPPTELEPSVVSEPGRPSTPESMPDISVGAPSELSSSPRSPIAKDLSAPSPDGRRALPSRYRPRSSTIPSQPSPAPSSDDGDPEKTPTRQHEYREEKSRRPSESTRTDSRSLWAEDSKHVYPQADDTPPPPPPAHRSPPSPSPRAADTSTPKLSPPVDKQSNDRVKRRGSSPLKHEYLPSDTSSASGAYSTEESEPESSDDEIESVDIPETELGVSIKQDTLPEAESQVSAVSAASACSLTPSNSASQAGLHGPKAAPEDKAERFIATISRWSDKGTWKDMSAHPCSIIVKAGLVEAYNFHKRDSKKDDRPLLALDLTPLVLIRQSTALDLEIRSSVQPHCLLHPSHGGGNFRFRCHSAPECFSLYMSVHHARLNNQKFIQLENEARFKSFGERNATAAGEGSSSSRRRGWFGRKNSYRGSVRAPSQSHDGTSTTPSSVPSASTFLKKLTLAGNLSFNIARSSVDRQGAGSGGGGNSMYTLNSSSSGASPLRSPSVSMAESGRHSASPSTENIKIRLHLLLVAAAKWEDYGNCSLQIRRPPPGWRQALRANHGLEKRVTVTTVPKKESEAPKVVLDAVLGSGCFSGMGSRGIVCGVWEEVKDGDGVVGMVPATGATGGNIKKWCFQLATAGEAGWVLRLLHQEVLRA